jgi:ABC-type Zn2+ transport system substrate-binding protein/surface adhesin
LGNMIMRFIQAIKIALMMTALMMVIILLMCAEDNDVHDQEHELGHKSYQEKGHDHYHEYNDKNGDNDDEDSRNNGHDFYHDQLCDGCLSGRLSL